MPNIKIQKTGVKIYLLCQGFSPLLILALDEPSSQKSESSAISNY